MEKVIHATDANFSEIINSRAGLNRHLGRMVGAMQNAISLFI